MCQNYWCWQLFCLVLSGSHSKYEGQTEACAQCRLDASLLWRYLQLLQEAETVQGIRGQLTDVVHTEVSGEENRQHVRSGVCHHKRIQLFTSHIFKQYSRMNSFFCLTNESLFCILIVFLTPPAPTHLGLSIKLETLGGAYMNSKWFRPFMGMVAILHV